MSDRSESLWCKSAPTSSQVAGFTCLRIYDHRYVPRPAPYKSAALLKGPLRISRWLINLVWFLPELSPLCQKIPVCWSKWRAKPLGMITDLKSALSPPRCICSSARQIKQADSGTPRCNRTPGKQSACFFPNVPELNYVSLWHDSHAQVENCARGGRSSRFRWWRKGARVQRTVWPPLSDYRLKSIRLAYLTMARSFSENVIKVWHSRREGITHS